MKAIEIGVKCIALPQYGLTANNQMKDLGNRVCYGSSEHGIKRDGGLDTCNYSSTPDNWQTSEPLFECTPSWLQANDRWSQWNGASAQILGGCGPGVPAGHYPDLTRKDSYCHCTGTEAPGNYQRQIDGTH